MAWNKITDNHHGTKRIAAPEDVTAGEVVLIGEALFAVALETQASGDLCEFGIEVGAVYRILKDTSLAITAGDRLFWDATNKWLDKTATAQQPVAVATADAGTTDVYVEAQIQGTAPAGA